MKYISIRVTDEEWELLKDECQTQGIQNAIRSKLGLYNDTEDTIEKVLKIIDELPSGTCFTTAEVVLTATGNSERSTNIRMGRLLKAEYMYGKLYDKVEIFDKPTSAAVIYVRK